MTLSVTEVRRIGYVVAFVRSWNDAMHFYSKLLGLEVIERDDRNGFAKIRLPEGGPDLLIEHADKTDVRGSVVGSFTGMSMVVPDIGQTYQLWSERGVRFDGPPLLQSWGGVLAHFLDPDDNMWSLVEEPRPQQSSPSTGTDRRTMIAFELQGIDHVALAVRDVSRSVAWYQQVLGLERYYQEAWGDFPAVVGVGNTSLALFSVEGNASKPTPARDVVAMRHLAFRADGVNFAKVQRALKETGITFQFQNHDISHSIYFEDLDGHEIEITTYDVRYS